MNRNSRILILGKKKYVNNFLEKKLNSNKFRRVKKINLNENTIDSFQSLKKVFTLFHPDHLFFLGGKSGGIKANINNPGSLMIDNLTLTYNIFKLSKEYKIKKMLYLASSCVYPKDAISPYKPEMILSGQLEPTNKSYALSKIIGIEYCNSFKKEFNLNAIPVIPSTIFGPGDDFGNDNNHVISSLIHKIHLAKYNYMKSITLWGSGKPVRDFIYVEDLADALIKIMQNYNGEKPINISSGEFYSIKELAGIIKNVVKYKNVIKFDNKNPDGVFKKILDIKPIKKLGWKKKYTLNKSIMITYQWYLKNYF